MLEVKGGIAEWVAAITDIIGMHRPRLRASSQLLSICKEYGSVPPFHYRNLGALLNSPCITGWLRLTLLKRSWEIVVGGNVAVVI